MQHQDAPPVEERDKGGDAVVALKAETPQAAPAAINNTVAFTALPWTIAIVPQCRAATMAHAPDEPGLVSLPIIRNLSLSLYLCARTPRRESSASWTIFSSKPRFRKLLA